MAAPRGPLAQYVAELPDELVRPALQMLHRLVGDVEGLEAEVVASLEVPEGCVGVVAEADGIFYVRPSLGYIPYTSQGDPVGVDQTIGVIESLKPRQEVLAGKHGLIMRTIGDGVRVEKGTVIAVIAILPSEQ